MAERRSKAENVTSLILGGNRWSQAGVIVCIVLGAMLIKNLFTNERFEWPTVWEYLFSREILQGLWLTIWLTGVILVLSTALGLVIALMRLSENLLLRSLANAYIWFFRGIPALVQLIFWFNLAALFPRIGIGIPFGPEFFVLDINSLITPITAAILAFTLFMAAYQGEIIRGGVLGVDAGQKEAAVALGYSEWQTMRKVVLPQAMRTIIPPVANEAIAVLKGTSLVSIISVVDLLNSAQLIYTRTYEVIPLLIVASIWYLVVVSFLTLGQNSLEQKFARGVGLGKSRKSASPVKIAQEVS